MKKTLVTLLAVLALALGAAGLIGTAALAGPDHRHDGHGFERGAGMHHDRFVDRMARRLDLSDEQRERIGAIMAAGAAEMRDQARALREVRRDLRSLGFADAFDAERAGELAQRQGELSAGLALARVERMNEVHGVLTPAQREKLAGWRAKHDAKDRRHH